MLLTFADTLGTGSGRGYSDWKDLLLWQLYHRTTSCLSGVKEFRAMAEKARMEIQERLLKNLDRQFDPAEVVAHFESLPPTYFETMSEELIREHISLVHAFLKYQLTHDDVALKPIVHWRNFPEQGHSEVTVVTWDRYHIFARVTGAFSACNLTILKADIFTRSDDIAIETFFVATERLESVTDPRDRASFEKILSQAMGTEEFDFPKAFAKKAVKARFPSTTRRNFRPRSPSTCALPRRTPCSTSRPPIIPACSTASPAPSPTPASTSPPPASPPKRAPLSTPFTSPTATAKKSNPRKSSPPSSRKSANESPHERQASRRKSLLVPKLHLVNPV